MTTISIHILTTKGHAAPGKLADAEIPFTGGELDGLKLVGFAVWTSRDGRGQNVSFPSRHFTVHGDSRAFSLLRWVAKTEALDRLSASLLTAYRTHAGQASDGSEPQRKGGVS